MVDFPAQPEDMSVAWLTSALRAAAALGEGRVASFAAEVLTVDKGITGVLNRLRLTYDRHEPGAPTSLVAKFSSPNPDLRAVLHDMRFFEREVRFYAELAAATPIRTPRCYFAGIDMESGWSLLLLEDLSGFRNGSWVTGSSLVDLRLALDEISAVHAAWWESPVLAAKGWLDLAGLTSVPQMQQIAVETWQPFLARLSVPVTAEVLAAGELIGRHLRTVGVHLLETSPRTLVHYDFDGDNLFFPCSEGQRGLAVIDWQLTTRGNPAVDVAWLVAGQLDPPLRRAEEERLVAGYHARLVERGVSGYSFDSCWEDYRRAMLLAAARVSTATGVQPGPRGGFWDVVFPRYAAALADLQVGDLLEARRRVSA